MFHVDFIHIFEIPSNWPKVFGTHYSLNAQERLKTSRDWNIMAK